MKKRIKKKTPTDLVEDMFKRLRLKARYIEKSGCGASFSMDAKKTKK